MRRLTFEEALHETNSWPYVENRDAYAIDFINGGRKYKQVERGIRVYEGGMVEVTHDTRRNPNLRREYERAYGVSFVYLSDTAGWKFTAPDGSPVKKSEITHHSMLLVDYDHSVAVAFAHGPNDRRGVYYPSWSAMPVGRSVVTVKRRNKGREAQWLKENEDFLRLCVTTSAMLSTDRGMYKYHNATRMLLQGTHPVGNVEGELRTRHSIGVEYQNGELFKQLREHCLDTIEYQYLCVSKE